MTFKRTPRCYTNWAPKPSKFVPSKTSKVVTAWFCLAARAPRNCNSLQEEGLYDAIREFSGDGGAIFGTCAGAILLATKVKNPPQDSLKLLDMTVLRNAYGRQLASDVFFGSTKLKKEPLEMVFIRGPVIEKVAPGIGVLAKFEGKPALVEKGHILAATFHPELTGDTTVHEHFLKLASNGSKPKRGGRQRTE